MPCNSFLVNASQMRLMPLVEGLCTCSCLLYLFSPCELDPLWYPEMTVVGRNAIDFTYVVTTRIDKRASSLILNPSSLNRDAANLVWRLSTYSSRNLALCPMFWSSPDRSGRASRAQTLASSLWIFCCFSSTLANACSLSFSWS
ncbi:uncharacterized protein G2W53_010570 [Senna tora]|uniref:Uncharacterized protein n=1 Tax=Senna tora TaxID=362788 RepID=A0A835CBJ7_9FABA|nr:uncharacterized protein G2W53_010570 [Senna tora]